MMRRFAVTAVSIAMLLGATPAMAVQDVGSDATSTEPTPVVLPHASGVAAVPGEGTTTGVAEEVRENRRFATIVPRNTGTGRRIIYSNSRQWVWVIDKDETVVRSMAVSGRRGVPATGSYRVTTKSPWSFSLDFEGVTFRWMTRFATGPAGGNIGFHEIPRKDGQALQSYAQLGSFAGSGCVRMATEDVKFIYQWAKPGTPVIVAP